MIPLRLRRPSCLLRSLLILAGVVLLPACGVDFEESDRAEMFSNLRLSGDRFVNRELTLELGVKASYQVPVRVACYYEDRSKLTAEQRRVAFADRALVIGEKVLEPVAAEHPTQGAKPRTLRFLFSVPSPGVYYLGCTTPAAPENRINISFEIKPAIEGVAKAP